jgi:hypothetical protein
MSTRQSIYNERLRDLKEKRERLKTSSRQMGWVRLEVFLILVAVLIWVILPLQSPLIFMSSLIVGVVLFLIPLSYHQRLLDSLAYTETLIRVNEYEIDPKEKLFSDGVVYAEHSSLAADIDIVGHGSLYQLLNRCVTSFGNTALVKNLIANPPNPDFIRKRQSAVQGLSIEIDLRQDLIAIGLQGISTVSQKLLSAGKSYYATSGWKVLLTAWPYFSALAIALGVYVHGAFYALPFLAWWPLMQQSKRVQDLYREISGTSSVWKSYAKLFNRFDSANFKSEELVALKSVTHGASEAIQKLAKLSARWDQRQNGLAIGFMNTLSLFDIKCAYDYEGWKRDHQAKLSDWLEAIGQIEMLNSLATFAYNHENYIYPTLKSGNPEIDIQKMGHPLVATTSIVTNSIHLGSDGNVYVITGSNMSGKSTFLRAVGLNMILAQVGAPVFAEAMTFTPLFLHTSFRQSDSVQENTSYFMAELKRLKEIMTAVDQPGGSLVLLDEILRGTNSEDKSHGSEVLLEKLMTKTAITLLATHDLKLGDLQTVHPGKVVNYCFESEIREGELLFDYTIRPGIAKNKNATFLMKKMGII